MMNELKKIMFAAIGTASTAYEKIDEFIKEMVEKGKMTVEDGKELSEELKRNVEEKASEATNIINKKLDEIKHVSKDEVHQIICSYNFATEEEVDGLKERIRELEEKIYEDR